MKILIVDFNGYSPTYTHYFWKALNDNENINADVIGTKNISDLSIFVETANYIGFKSRYKIVNYLFNWMILFKVSKKYDIIHFQWLPLLKYSSLDIWLVKALKMVNKKILYTVHNFEPHNVVKINEIKRYYSLYGTFKKLVVHTNKTRDKIRNLELENDVFIFNHGLFYSEFRRHNIFKLNKNNHYNIIMVGFISQYKGYEDAIKAIAILNEKDKGNYFLQIKGKGSNTFIAKLNNLIQELSMQEYIVIQEGYLETVDLISTYHSAHLTLMPYKKIEQSGVALTSLGLGVPIVAYNIGGISNVIKNGINGYLVDSNNVKSLALGIENSFKNNDYLQKNILSNCRLFNTWKDSSSYLISKYTEMINE